MFDDLAAATLDSLDDMLLAIQQFFCRHQELIPAKYDGWYVLCTRCGKRM